MEPLTRALVRSTASGGAVRRRRRGDRHRDEHQRLSSASPATLSTPCSAPPCVRRRWVRRTPRRSGPRLCALSGQDVDKLRRIGAETLGVIGHTSVVCVALSPWANQMMGTWWGNQEMTEVTQGVYAARQLAMDEVRRQAVAAGANDMVISTLEHDIDHHEYESARLPTALLHRLHARPRHGDPARRARASPGPARRADHVDQPRRLARVHSMTTTTTSGEQPMSTYDPTSTEGLAEHASERLRMNARGLFTSDLSVNEYLCVEKAGFEPVGPRGRARASTTSASSSRTGRRARRWASSPRRCTPPASSR